MYITASAFIAIDIVTGLLGALKNKCYRSSHMRDGLYRKIGSFLTILFGWAVEYANDLLGLGFNVPVAEAVIIYVVVMEAGSIIENIGVLNAKIVPPFIKKFFEKLRQEESEDED